MFFSLKRLALKLNALSFVLVLNALLGGCAQPFIQQTQNQEPQVNTFGVDLTSITSFDVYVEQDRVHILLSGNVDNNSTTQQVRYARSIDGGLHWQILPINLVTPPPIAIRGNDVQLAAAGDTILALWQTSGELPGMGPMVSIYSTDSGQYWHLGTNPAGDNQGDQSHLDVIADNRGLFHVVWLADPEEQGYQSLHYAQNQHLDAQWQQHTTLDNSTCSCCWNTLLLSEDTINILYRDMQPRDMALLQTVNTKNHWQGYSVGQFNWQFTGCPHIGGALAHGAAPLSLHSLVWTGAEQKQGLYYLRSTNNGHTWTVPQRLGQKARHSDLTTNNQTVLAVWDEMQPNGTQIFSARSKDTGVTWELPQALSADTALATHPRVTHTSAGFLVLWTQKTKQSGQTTTLKFTVLPE